MKTQTQIKPGIQFRSVVADANVLFEVKAKSGRGAWRCVGVDETYEVDGRKYKSDFAGEVRVFTNEQILSAVGWEKAFAAAHDASDAFYSHLRIGQIVHYCNGGDEFIRCEVVWNVDKQALKPVALVGKWRSFDLPRRQPDGSVYLGYQAEKIQKGEPWRPSAGCVYESPESSHRHGLDPRELPAIDLSVPELDDEAAKKAALWKAVDAARAALDTHQGDPTELLRKAQAIITSALGAV